MKAIKNSTEQHFVRHFTDFSNNNRKTIPKEMFLICFQSDLKNEK
jgi:hypothetical protein